jgi:hypothetical protein
MRDNMLMGISRFIIPIPSLIWRRQVPIKARRLSADLRFMSAQHHLVRNYVVRELPSVGKPMSPESIAQSVKLTITQVNSILDDLEEHKTFLYRNEQGAVTWAYPVTIEKTPHHVALSSGEQFYAP